MMIVILRIKMIRFISTILTTIPRRKKGDVELLFCLDHWGRG